MPHSIRLGMVGINDFAEQLLHGILSNNVIPAQSIVIADKNKEKMAGFEPLGVYCCQDDFCTLIKSEIIIISVPKGEFGTTLAPIHDLTRGRVIISTAEGIDCDFILERITSGTHAVTAIPKKLESGAIVTSIVYSKGFPDYLKTVCGDIFRSIGAVDVKN